MTCEEIPSQALPMPFAGAPSFFWPGQGFSSSREEPPSPYFATFIFNTLPVPQVSRFSRPLPCSITRQLCAESQPRTTIFFILIACPGAWSPGTADMTWTSLPAVEFSIVIGTHSRYEERPRSLAPRDLGHPGLLLWANCQTVAGDWPSMNPNRDDAVVGIHAFQRRFSQENEIGDLARLNAPYL